MFDYQAAFGVSLTMLGAVFGLACWLFVRAQQRTDTDIVISKVYTDAECDALRDDDMIIAENAILRCTPKLYYSKYAAGATIDFAFNVGGANYCESTMARKFEAGDIAGGCKQYVNWVYSKGKFMQGLLDNRRKPEQRVCEKALS